MFVGARMLLQALLLISGTSACMCRIYIKDVLSLGAEKGKEELKAQKYRVVLPDNTYSGEISVAVTFTLNVM